MSRVCRRSVSVEVRRFSFSLISLSVVCQSKVPNTCERTQDSPSWAGSGWVVSLPMLASCQLVTQSLSLNRVFRSAHQTCSSQVVSDCPAPHLFTDAYRPCESQNNVKRVNSHLPDCTDSCRYDHESWSGQVSQYSAERQREIEEAHMFTTTSGKSHESLVNAPPCQLHGRAPPVFEVAPQSHSNSQPDSQQCRNCPRAWPYPSSSYSLRKPNRPSFPKFSGHQHSFGFRGLPFSPAHEHDVNIVNALDRPEVSVPCT